MRIELDANTLKYKAAGAVLLLLSAVFLTRGMKLSDSAKADQYYEQRETIMGFIHDWNNNHDEGWRNRPVGYHDEAEKLTISVGELHYETSSLNNTVAVLDPISYLKHRLVVSHSLLLTLSRTTSERSIHITNT